jgi:Rieske Fe-S protein
MLLVIGRGFKTGHGDTLACYGELRDFVETHFNVHSLEYRWINQDYYSSDRIPYVGHITPVSKHIYTATGFSGWGITNGVAAAMMICDAINDRHNPWADLFNANRFKFLESTGKVLRAATHVAKTWTQDHLQTPRGARPETLAPGTATVTEVDGDKIAAWRDDDGILHRVSAVCTHMGCTVRWNDFARTWECPCHGSRFGINGEVLNGPAVRPLAKKPPFS